MSELEKSFESFANHWRYDLTTDENGFYQDLTAQRVFDAWSTQANRINELQREKVELAAQARLMKDALIVARASVKTCYKQGWAEHSELEEVENAINSSPDQCLNQIKAEAYKEGQDDIKAFIYSVNHANENQVSKWFDKYAASIAKGESNETENKN